MNTSDPSDETTVDSIGDEYHYEQALEEIPSQAVITAVAEATGRPVVPSERTGSDDGADALSPLYEAIAPEALDALVATGDTDGEDCLVTFTYCDCTVTVGKHDVTVTPVSNRDGDVNG